MGMIVFIIVSILTIVPLRKLLPHFGINANWAFAAVIPFGPLVLLWVMAARLQERENL